MVNKVVQCQLQNEHHQLNHRKNCFLIYKYFQNPESFILINISSGSASNQIEWAVKGPAKLKYTQLFNATDRTRSGYLTGVQARGILMQSKLPQMTLAQIWALSDMDSDGRLGCEEFVLAMYLCDMVSYS